MTTFTIKNMVCQRCINAVRETVESSGYKIAQISLGKITIEENQLSAKSKEELNAKLKSLGFELLDDKNQKIVATIKAMIIDRVHYDFPGRDQNLSDALSTALGMDYSKISQLFSSVENVSIERYFILQRIEKVKELLVYDELSLKQICYDLNFSSVPHLSAQFKKVTGMTPTSFKKLNGEGRTFLDEL